VDLENVRKKNKYQQDYTFLAGGPGPYSSGQTFLKYVQSNTTSGVSILKSGHP
jgi:hypothetical protein